MLIRLSRTQGQRITKVKRSTSIVRKNIITWRKSSTSILMKRIMHIVNIILSNSISTVIGRNNIKQSFPSSPNQLSLGLLTKVETSSISIKENRLWIDNIWSRGEVLGITRNKKTKGWDSSETARLKISKRITRLILREVYPSARKVVFACLRLIRPTKTKTNNTAVTIVSQTWTIVYRISTKVSITSQLSKKNASYLKIKSILLS